MAAARFLNSLERAASSTFMRDHCVPSCHTVRNNSGLLGRPRRVAVPKVHAEVRALGCAGERRSNGRCDLPSQGFSGAVDSRGAPPAAQNGRSRAPKAALKALTTKSRRQCVGEGLNPHTYVQRSEREEREGSGYPINTEGLRARRVWTPIDTEGRDSGQSEKGWMPQRHGEKGLNVLYRH